MIPKVKMVRTKAVNNKDRLLTPSLNYCYSLTLLRVESKKQNYSKFRLERKRRKTKIPEWPPPSFNQINLESCLGILLPKKFSQETIRNPGGSVDKLEEAPPIYQVPNQSNKILDNLG